MTIELTEAEAAAIERAIEGHLERQPDDSEWHILNPVYRRLKEAAS